MDTTNAEPITWNADDFMPGDKFSIPPYRNKIYTVKERNERHGMIELKANLWSKLDEEDWGVFRLTYPADFPLTAERRIRTIDAECMLCQAPVQHTLDTAFFTFNNAVCGKH